MTMNTNRFDRDQDVWVRGRISCWCPPKGSHRGWAVDFGSDNHLVSVTEDVLRRAAPELEHCSVCGGDCSAANPPVTNCPNRSVDPTPPASVESAGAGESDAAFVERCESARAIGYRIWAQDTDRVIALARRALTPPSMSTAAGGTDDGLKQAAAIALRIAVEKTNSGDMEKGWGAILVRNAIYAVIDGTPAPSAMPGFAVSEAEDTSLDLPAGYSLRQLAGSFAPLLLCRDDVLLRSTSQYNLDGWNTLAVEDSPELREFFAAMQAAVRAAVPSAMPSTEESDNQALRSIAEKLGYHFFDDAEQARAATEAVDALFRENCQFKVAARVRHDAAKGEAVAWQWRTIKEIEAPKFYGGIVNSWQFARDEKLARQLAVDYGGEARPLYAAPPVQPTLDAWIEGERRKPAVDIDERTRIALADLLDRLEAANPILLAPAPAAGMERAAAALREIKLLCVTMGAAGEMTVPEGLSRIVRLCRDCMVTDGLAALRADTRQDTGGTE